MVRGREAKTEHRREDPDIHGGAELGVVGQEDRDEAAGHFMSGETVAGTARSGEGVKIPWSALDKFTTWASKFLNNSNNHGFFGSFRVYSRPNLGSIMNGEVAF
jgi:hypothetical protein